MPTYVLEATDSSGDQVSITCPMSERPEYGERRVIDGREYIRLPSCEQQQRLVVAETNFVARSRAPHDPDFPRTNEHGEGVFVGMQEVREYVAKRRAQGEEITYDRVGF